MREGGVEILGIAGTSGNQSCDGFIDTGSAQIRVLRCNVIQVDPDPFLALERLTLDADHG